MGYGSIRTITNIKYTPFQEPGHPNTEQTQGFNFLLTKSLATLAVVSFARTQSTPGSIGTPTSDVKHTRAMFRTLTRDRHVLSVLYKVCCCQPSLQPRHGAARPCFFQRISVVLCCQASRRFYGEERLQNFGTSNTSSVLSKNSKIR